MPTNIIYYTDTSGFGGAEQVLLTQLKSLDRNRWCPAVICHPASGITPMMDEVRKLDLPLWLVPHMPEGIGGLLRLPSFMRKLSVWQPMIFHAHLTWPRACKYGLIGAILTRVPVIVATEHLFVDVPYNRFAILQQRLIAKGVDRYIAVSNEVSHRIHQTYGISQDKLQVIYNAVPQALSASDSLTIPADAPWSSSKMPIVLSVARLDKQKGHRYLLEAAKQVPEALFVLVGEGDERADLETYAVSLGLLDRVFFTGFRNDVPRLLAQCDVFVLPSLYEGLPISILEAMEAAKPVIATTVGGVDEEIIDGETGLLVPPADSEALAGAIRRLLADHALCRKLANAGRNRVRSVFSVQAMMQQLTQLYESLLVRSGK
ncbi:MAG: glycosyltransferase [Gammaproteobacteria bacterium]|nr:glycosyltransferase [Gammaproteobacteria bacterium]